MKNKKGFTLIELLVVIAIIGLLSTLAVVSLNSARSKARDARRTSDIRQIQTALDMYYNDQGEYPTEASVVNLGSTADSTLSSTNGFAATAAGTPYMASVPGDPQSTDQEYEYTSVDGSTYTIDFTLENTNSSWNCTDCQAAPGSITAQ